MLVDHKVVNLLGYTAEEMLDTSLCRFMDESRAGLWMSSVLPATEREQWRREA
jgi:hypothetical protein